MGKIEKYLYTRNNWLQSQMGYLDAAEASGRVKFVRRMFVWCKQGVEAALVEAEAELVDLDGPEAVGFADELERFRGAVESA